MPLRAFGSCGLLALVLASSPGCASPPPTRSGAAHASREATAAEGPKTPTSGRSLRPAEPAESGKATGEPPVSEPRVREPAPALELPEIDRLVTQAIEEGKLVGAVVAVGRREGLLFLRAYGERAVLPEREPTTVDTIFDLASLTKPVVTAALIAKQVERGALRLDDTLARHLPELAADAKGRITVRELLTHASGLPSIDALGSYTGPREAALASVLQQKVRLGPKAFNYSDLGFVLLGALLERVTGERLDRLAARELFEPLRMLDTGFAPPAALRARIAPTERLDPRRLPLVSEEARAYGFVRGQAHDPRAFRLEGVAGNAGLFSTASDLARYARMLLGQGSLDGVRLLAKSSVQALTAPAFVGETVRTLGWDMRSKYSGLRGGRLSHRAFGHGGFTGTSLWIDPALDLFVVFLSNRVHPDGKGYVIPLAGAIADAAARHVEHRPAARSTAHVEGRVQAGIDVLREDDFRALAGKRVGVVVNRASRARDGTTTLELLRAAQDVQLVAIFAPEHGLEAEREGRIESGALFGVPVHSLFGRTRRPTEAMLQGLDAIVFDLQDVGVRFYTYLSTLRQLLEATAGTNIEIVVLDRPNPLGALLSEGPVLEAGRETFVNYHTLPLRHGLTAGEMAKLLAAERNIPAKLHVVRMRNYCRQLPFASTGLSWHAPSPNLPSLEATLLYPAVGMLESANLSVGRGTDRPFGFVGAPFLDAARLVTDLAAENLPGVSFRASERTPTRDKYAGVRCHGVEVQLEDPRTFRPVHTGLALAKTIVAQRNPAFRAHELGRLIGHARTLEQLSSGADLASLQRLWEPDLMRWEQRKSAHLLYDACHELPAAQDDAP